MNFRRSHHPIAWVALFLAGAQIVRPAPVVLDAALQIRLIMNTPNASGARSVRLAKDPRDDRLYYLKFNGDIHRVSLQPGSGTSTSVKAYGATDHGIADSAQGMAIGPDGTIYVVANTTTNSGNSTFARIMKGVPDGRGGRAWSLLARTEPYPRSLTAFDHVFNGIVVSPDGNFLYVNSGSRTDHGEVQSIGGLFPDTREVALTAKIFRLPARGSDLLLPNDSIALLWTGYIFAEGTRNSFDFAFAPNGDLFATENGPDRDMSEELNWLRPGLHYGFPWRIGGSDNPQQFPNYAPGADRLLDQRFIAVQRGYYHNDPTFPPPPTGFAEPVVNVGPDANRYRDPGDGSIKDAGGVGRMPGTFTAHRSPLGLVFDTAGAMGPPFQNHGFMLSWTPGDANGTNVAGPFKDASQDLVDLDLTRLGNTNYQARVTRMVGGFSNPIDAEIISNKVYVIEYGGNQAIWEITFPARPTPITLGAPARQSDGSFRFNVSGAPGRSYTLFASTNLLDWLSLTNLMPNSSPFPFVDSAATNYPHRFYRVQQP
jgi:hypothetical protein